jgi:hypothetical protein
MEPLKEKVRNLASKVPELSYFCNRCLETKRYGGNVILMVADAAFVSIGINYFNVVVPAVLRLRNLLEDYGIEKMADFLELPEETLLSVWKNRRSWSVAREVMNYLSKLDIDDRKALRRWAANSGLQSWRKDPIGSVRGVGINTYQYLRMMGGIDTVMPDKIVRRVLSSIVSDTGIEPPQDDIEFILWVEELSKITGYRSIELCWMTWFVQYDEIKIEKYRKLMREI